MSYIGVVHRKDTDTGVTVKAKIVTPNKRKATEKNYKVTVKAETISDYTCCVIDNSTAKQKIVNSGIPMDDITESIGSYFTTAGLNGTKSTYYIQGSAIEQCIDQDGTFRKHPKLGAGAANGTIEIVTEKGDAKVISHIQITVKEVTPTEIFEIELSKQKVWDTIRGSNGTWANNGYSNIRNNLNLVSRINSEYLDGSKAITVQWSVEDDASVIAAIPELSGRLDATTGVVDPAKRPSYEDAYTAWASVGDETLIAPDSDTNMAKLYWFRCYGLTLTGVFTLEGEERTITFDLGTASKYLTSAEVLNKLKVNTNLKVSGESGGAPVGAAQFAVNAGSAVSFTFNSANSGNLLRTVKGGAATGFQIYGTIQPEFELAITNVAGENGALTSQQLSNLFDNSDAASIFQQETTAYQIANIMADRVASAYTEGLTIVINGEIVVMSYSPDGISRTPETARQTVSTKIKVQAT